MSVKHIFKKTNIKVFTPALIGILLVAGVFYFYGLTIEWMPEKFSEKVFISGSSMTEISFVSKQDLSEINAFIVPELKSFISVKPEQFTFIKAGEENKLELKISIPQDMSPGIIEGTIQLKALKQKGKGKSSKTFAKPLPVILEIVKSTDAVNLLNDFLIEEFGTLTPSVLTVSQSMELPTEIKEAFSEGATEAVVIKSGSLIFSGSMIPNSEAALGMFDLLHLLEEKGIVIEDLNSVFTNHDLHKESVESGGAMIPIYASAVTFYPWPKALNLSDSDANGKYDTFVIVLDNDTHAVHNVEDIEKLINRDFIKEDGYLTKSASTAIHELFHAMIFRTSCFVGSIEEEEDFVALVERLINLKISDSHLFIPRLREALQLFPQGKDCLDRLGFILPPTEWSLPEILDTAPPELEFNRVAVTSDNLGNLHLLRGKLAEIYYTKRDETGWSESIAILEEGWGVDIVSDNLNHLHVISMGRGDTTTADVFYMMWDGAGWSEPLNITHGAVSYAGASKIAVDSNNNPHVVWEGEGPWPKVFYIKETNGSWSEPVVISPPPADAYCGSSGPLIVADNNDNLHVIMNTYLSLHPITTTLFYTKWDGSEWSEPINLNISGEDDYKLAVDRFNHPHVLVGGRISGKHGMYHIYWDGSNWTSSVDISGTGNFVDGVYVTVDDLGIIHTIWREQLKEALPEFEYQILYSSYDGTSWSEPEIIPNIPVKCYPMGIAADIFNHVHVIYQYSQDTMNYLSHIWR